MTIEKRKKYVKCSKCNTVDSPRWINKDEYTVGTATTMQCEDCNMPNVATCRACCPSEHGTKWREADYDH